MGLNRWVKAGGLGLVSAGRSNYAQGEKRGNRTFGYSIRILAVGSPYSPSIIKCFFFVEVGQMAVMDTDQLG